MDQNSLELSLTIIREKLKVFQNVFENENLALKSKLDIAISQLEADAKKSVFILQTDYRSDLEGIKTDFQSKINELESEIEYLNELQSSQNLMLENTFLYAQKLEDEIKNLNNR